MRGLNTKRLLAATAGLVLVLGVAACGDDDDDDGGGGGGEAQLDLVIGDSIPLTGDLSDFGPPGQKASDVAATQITDAIKAAGVDHTVKVVHEDNETNPQAAVQAARKLVDSDGASCITGAWASADTIPTAQSVSIPDGILQISPASTSDEITALDDDGLINRTSPPDIVPGPDARRRDRRGPRQRRRQGRQHRRPQRLLRNGPRGHVQGGVGGPGRHDRPGGHLRPRAAELQLGGRPDHRGQPRCDRDHRFPGDLRQGRPGAAAHG